MAGPYKMKADIRIRSTRRDEGRVKVCVAVFVCSVTSAVKLYIAWDYSEEGFYKLSALSKKSPFIKIKLALMYSKEEQIKDMEEKLRNPLASLSSVDMTVVKRNKLG